MSEEQKSLIPENHRSSRNDDALADALAVSSEERNEDEILRVDLGTYEGPIDLLLELARKQKVDLTQISVLTLARQYIAFIEKAKVLKLEIAADYLVMAAWLAYLKSRLLLPEKPSDEEELSSVELAAALAFQLKRLEKIQEAAAGLFSRKHLNTDFFPRGKGEPLNFKGQLEFDLKLHDLLSSYAGIISARQKEQYEPKSLRIFSIEDALRRLSTMLGLARDWISLTDFMPLDGLDGILKSSTVASTFGASLELAKQGRIELKQDKNFAPLYMRTKKETE